VDQLLAIALGIAAVVLVCVVLVVVNSLRARRRNRPAAHTGVPIRGQNRRRPTNATNHQANPETSSKSKRFPDLDHR